MPFFSLNPYGRTWFMTEKLLAFLVVIVNMGLIRKSSLKDYGNLKDWSQSTPFFPEIFTRDRFFMLQSMLHFPESAGETDKLKKGQ